MPGAPGSRMILTMSVPIRVRRLPHGRDLPLPAYATAGAAGMDLLAAVADPLEIPPGGRALVPTGLALAAVLLLAIFFRPPERGPAAVDHAEEKAPLQPEGGVPSPP